MTAFLLVSMICCNPGFADGKETPAAPPGSTPIAPTVTAPPHLSQEEFVKQRQFMIKDLERKIKALQKAKKCAVKSSNPIEFRACNETLVNEIHAHNQAIRDQQKKSTK